MSTILYLVRHGQTNSNVSGYFMGRSAEDLDATGRQQASHLSSRLAAQQIAAVYTSPLRRTLTTAEIIAAPHGIAPKAEEDLLEMDLGEWQEMHRDDVKKRWPDLWRQTRIDPSEVTLPGGESYQELFKRAAGVFTRIAESHKEQKVVIVTHDALVRMMVAHVLEVNTHIYRRIMTDNASLTTVHKEGKTLRLISLNDTAHLE